MAAEPDARPEGIPGSTLARPVPGRLLRAAPARLAARPRARAALRRGVVNCGRAAAPRSTSSCATATARVPCSMWRDEFDALRLDRAALADGAQIVVAGGPDYYPGVAHLLAVVLLPRHRPARGRRGRPAGPARPAAQGAGGRGAARAAEARCTARSLPRTIGVVTGERGKARDDVLAGLRRRGWAGRLVWAFAPVQDRHAAPAITRALQDLAAGDEVDVIVVARGGGSLADLFAFCDETLCRTVALLRGAGDRLGRPPHRPHADRRRRRGELLDPDARGRDGGADRLRPRPAPTCSRPGGGCRSQSRRAVLERARGLAAARPRARRARRPPPPPPAPAAARDARQRPPPASATSATLARRRLLVLERKAAAATGAGVRERARDLERLRLAAGRPRPRAHARARLSRWSRTTTASW